MRVNNLAKLSGALLLALGLCLSLGLSSWADPPGGFGPGGMKGHPGHWGHRGKMAQLTPEQAGKLFDLRQKFLDDSAALRKDMVVKKAELRALWRTDSPDEKLIVAKLKEINAVKDKLIEKVVPLRLAVKKILPPGPGPEGAGPKGKVSMGDEEMNPDAMRGPGPKSQVSMEFEDLNPDGALM